MFLKKRAEFHSPPAEILPLLDKYVPRDGVIIDVGAGEFTQLFAQSVPQGHVYAFEPVRHARMAISKAIVSKKLHNVSLFPLGLGDKDCEEILGGSGGCPVMSSGEKITLTTLDRFASRHSLKRIDFIRAGDIRMLHGANQVIEKFKPLFFFANHDKEMQDFLKALNYSIENTDIDKIIIMGHLHPHQRSKGK